LRPWRGLSSAFLGKLSYKHGITPWLAVSMGLGGAHAATGDSLGGDLAFHGSLEPWHSFRPYAGLRYSLAQPFNRGYEEAGGATQGAAAALGGMVDFSPRWQGFAELGQVKVWHTGYVSTVDDPTRQSIYLEHEGGYAALGITTYFGKLWDEPSSPL